MRKSRFATLLALGLVGLIACAPRLPVADPIEGAGLIRVIKSPIDKPPSLRPGECQDHVTLPMVIETTSEQVLVAPEVRDSTGKVTSPARYASQTRQRIVQDRHEVWFRTPCPESWSVNFIASLQRALTARGLLSGGVTGEYDNATAEAVRRFQAARGLDATVLSLDAARELGLAALDLRQ